ncbi:hypothetical protein OAX78_02100 [Planctomycetota bacterium]|nr:hypothetical protein [Planctomycetota bacterium]
MNAPSPTRSRLLPTGAAVALIAIGCHFATTYGEEPREVVAPPPTWDADAAAVFAAGGLAVPQTVMTVETDDELDLAWLRSAMGFAEPLSDEERQRYENGGGAGGEAQADGMATPRAEASGGDMEEEMPGESRNGDFGAPAPEPPMAPPADAERAMEGLAQGAAESESGRPARRRAGAAGSSLDDAAPGQAGGPSGEDGGDADEVRQPVLSRIETAPRLGKILIQNEQGQYESLETVALRVVTFVEGPRARTVVDLVFRNPHPRQLQGTFHYPLPDGASPAGFGMFPGTLQVTDGSMLQGAPLLPSLPASLSVEDLSTAAPQSAPVAGRVLVEDWQPMQVARVVEQKRAAQVYEEIVRGNVDPALLEWSGGNTFKARVFPIQSQSLKRVVLAYEQTLPRDGDVLRYVHPFPGDPAVGEVDVHLLLRKGTVQLLPGQNGEGVLREPAETTEDATWQRHRFHGERGYEGTLDLALRPAGNVGNQVISAAVPGMGRPFYARITPDVPVREAEAPTGRVVFLVDTSLSEDGVRRNLSGELLLKVLEQDATIEQFSVMLFDVRARWLHQAGWLDNTAEQRQATRNELAKVYLEGATNFSAVLDELDRQAQWIDADQPATRFLLSDGLITWGLDRVDALLAAHPAALGGRFLSYRFGEAPVNRDLYDALARETAGRTVNVLTADQLDQAAVAHRNAPVLLEQVRVAGGEVVDLVVAGEPKLVFPGQELEIGGRLTSAGDAQLELVLRVEGQEQVTQAAIPSAQHSLAPRAWAELWTRKLLALDDERLHRMVVALSQAFGLANEAASMLILEGEQDWVRFQLEDEQVDMSNLMHLRATEEDQRRDRLQGISLDEVDRAGRDVVRMLLEHGAPATQPAQPLLDRPLAGGDERLQAELTYRAEREKDEINAQTYDAVARVRALAGDTFGAVRAMSCLVEKRPRDAEANRLVGYACLALGQYEPAAELFERVRLNRPFEPQSYLEEALALDALGRWGDAARNYEILLAKQFPRHDSECKTAGAFHYARMLAGRIREGGLSDAQREQLEKRLQRLRDRLGDPLEKTALQMTIHWNTDSTDIDLWAVEPEGERCYYGHQQTAAGGRLYWDTTTGYGPELYRRVNSGAGRYDILIHYYGNNSARWTVPTSVLLVRDRDMFGPEDGYTRRFQMRILPDSNAVLPLRKETF